MAVNAVQKYLVKNTRLGIPALVHEECLTGLAAWKATTVFANATQAVATPILRYVADQRELIGGNRVALWWAHHLALRANGAKMGKGSGQVVDDTASGDLVASLAVDYITLDKIDKGATLALVYPPEMLLIPSPVSADFRASDIEPTMVTSRPSRIQTVPRPITTIQCHRAQGSRSNLAGMSVVMRPVSTSDDIVPS